MSAENIIPERVTISTRKHSLEGMIYHPKNPINSQVLIVPGRNEMLYKYQDFYKLLSACGIKVIIYDHIGQGFSPRITEDSQMCHIDTFDTYADDLVDVVDTLYGHMPLTVISISMGGLITLKALQNKAMADKIEQCIFISPFLGLKQHLPYCFIKAITHLRDFINRLNSSKKVSFFYFNDYFRQRVVGVDANTHSEDKNKEYYALYQKYPEAKLGGITTEWLRAALRCLNDVRSYRYNFKFKSLFVIAGNDNIVSSPDALRFVQKTAENSAFPPEMLCISDCLHDILIEDDPYRKQAIQSIMKFLQLDDNQQNTQGVLS